MATRGKNIWILIIFLLAGLVVGGLLGELSTKVEFLGWLSYGKEFGLAEPIKLDVSVLTLTFGIWFKLNIASIIGMAIALLIYSKL